MRSAMPIARALPACARTAVVRPDFRRYREASRRIMAILRSAHPLVEPLSLDEAYLDVTASLWGRPYAAGRWRRNMKRRIR